MKGSSFITGPRILDNESITTKSALQTKKATTRCLQPFSVYASKVAFLLTFLLLRRLMCLLLSNGGK